MPEIKNVERLKATLYHIVAQHSQIEQCSHDGVSTVKTRIIDNIECVLVECSVCHRLAWLERECKFQRKIQNEQKGEKP
jgi:hypothetical protein